MSAYVDGRGSQVLSFTGPLGPVQPGTLQAEQHVPSLPQIGSELEAYFGIARQIEAAYLQERAQSRKLREEMRDLQLRYSRYAAETDARLKDAMFKEEKLKAQLADQQQSGKNLQDQLNEVSKKLESSREDKKSLEIEVEILRSKLEHLKRNENSLQESLKNIQLGEQSRRAQDDTLGKELASIRNELAKYKSAWGQIAAIERKAKGTLRQSVETQQKLEEMIENCAVERKRRERFEELLQKEKREKQAALTCLHAAESRLAKMTHELEELRNKQIKSLEDSTLELKF